MAGNEGILKHLLVGLTDSQTADFFECLQLSPSSKLSRCRILHRISMKTIITTMM